MAPPDLNTAARVQEFTRRFPVLSELPESERIGVVQQAARHPLVWGSGLAVMALLFPLLAKVVFYLQEQHALKAIVFVGILCLCLLLPVVFHMQGRVIKQIIARRRTGARDNQKAVG